MTVSQLKTILDELEKAGAGDHQIRFCCEAKRETNANGTGAVVLPFRVFDFSDRIYDFKCSIYLTNNGMYPCKTTVCTDNIDVTNETVTFHQS